MFRRERTANQSPRPAGVPIDMVIIHATASATADSPIRWMKDPKAKVSAHYLIDKSGNVTQLVPEDQKAWHAGASVWQNRPDLNNYSIGIELVNLNDGKDAYTDSQYVVLGELCADIVRRRNIDFSMIRGHYEVSPGRKSDPGENFDWKRLFAEIGWYLAGRNKTNIEELPQ